MRRKRGARGRIHLPGNELNIVPLIDILTTILFFLIVAAGFAHFSVVPGESAAPGASSENRPHFALQVMMPEANKLNVWVGPLVGLQPREGAAFMAWLKEEFTGSIEEGFVKTIEASDRKELVSDLQFGLSRIKLNFPDELRAVAAFSDQIPYQDFVDVIAAIRELPKGRALANLGPSATRVLFPSVIISEWDPAGSQALESLENGDHGGAR